MDLYSYRQRLGATNPMESMTNTTKIIVNNTFHDSPNFKVVYLNSIRQDARISVHDDSNSRKSILFRPNTKLFKGDIIESEAIHWFTLDTYDNEIYPTAYVKRCNEWLRWKDENGQLKVYPCVVEGEELSLDEGKYENRFLIIAENTISILVQYNLDTKKILPKQRFILNDIPYEIKGLDELTHVAYGKGYIVLKAEQTLLEVNDNLDNDIADNVNEGWGDWS